MRKDNLGDRMKSYENITRTYLPSRMPIIIRIDGKAFHTFTKGFKKPFDDILMRAMEETAAALCRDIEGVKVAYTQSDEISLLITNNDTWETQPWFGNNLQKMVSVAASIATLAFNRAFWREVNMLSNDYLNTEDTEHRFLDWSCCFNPLLLQHRRPSHIHLCLFSIHICKVGRVSPPIFILNHKRIQS
jgi:hypothetical protein